jgi:hypothetical protein
MRRYRKNPEEPVKSIGHAAQVLGVSVDATKEEVQRAFRKKSKTAHPDLGGSTEEQQLVNSANEWFQRRFDAEAAAAAAEEEDDIGSALRRRAAPRERVRPVMARPYRPGEVDWANAIPRWREVVNAAVIGLRSDGQADLLVNNTYITTLNSLLGLVEHLKIRISAQAGVSPTAWERYIVYIAHQSTGELTTVGLRNLWERVMLEEGASTHAPDLTRTRRMKPDDFS